MQAFIQKESHTLNARMHARTRHTHTLKKETNISRWHLRKHLNKHFLVSQTHMHSDNTTDK